MIEFRCQHCSQKLRVAESHAGRKSHCPRCKGALMIPPSAARDPAPGRETDGLTLIDPPKPLDDAPPDVSDQQQIAREHAEARRQERALAASLGIETQPEYTGERRLPAPIDILLYPTSGAGLIAVAVIGGFPLLTHIIGRLLPFGVPLVGLPFFLIGLAIGLYAGWYFAECVYDSARGGTRAPVAFGGLVGFREMAARVMYLASVYIVYVLPAVIYGGFLGRIDAIFWGLLAWAIVFFPIGLLAMVILDSSSTLNPFFLLVSIFRTFFGYLGLLVLMALLAGLFWIIPGYLAPRPEEGEPIPLWLLVPGLLITTYVPFVFAHVLGRFYWRHTDRLDWGL
ncbi:MAG: hypothetical protein JW741_24055 [Sedimentisphaerales bacterium]|nr:hypothetical protein [Sedimentisphaerales bacterium]